MMRKIFATPAVLAACLLVVTPAQAQFGSLLRKVTTPAPKPSEEDNGGCPKGKKGNSIGRNILGNVINDAVGEVVLGESALRAETLAQHIATKVRDRQGARRAEVNDGIDVAACQPLCRGDHVNRCVEDIVGNPARLIPLTVVPQHVNFL